MEQQEGQFMKGKTFLRQSLVKSMAFASLLGCATLAHGNGLQVPYVGLNNTNPAYSIGTVKQFAIDLDGNVYSLNFNPDLSIADGPFGRAYSADTNFLPAFRIAYRVAPQVALGFEVTHPGETTVSYSEGSFVRFLSQRTEFHETDFSPKLAINIDPHVAIAIGLDASYVSDSEISFLIPLGPNTAFPYRSYAKDSWAFGFDAGLFVTVRKGTYVGVSYFSELDHNERGRISLGPLFNIRGATKTSIPIPQLVRFDITQFVTPKWMFNLAAYWSNYSTLHDIKIAAAPIVGPVTIPLNYQDIWSTAVTTRYQFDNHWAGFFGIAYEGNPTPTAFNTPGLPLGALVAFYGGPEINFSEHTSLRLTYAHAISDSKFNSVQTAGRILGTNRTNINVVDLKLTFKE